jgi:hypothetical protein
MRFISSRCSLLKFVSQVTHWLEEVCGLEAACAQARHYETGSSEFAANIHRIGTHINSGEEIAEALSSHVDVEDAGLAVRADQWIVRKYGS